MLGEPVDRGGPTESRGVTDVQKVTQDHRPCPGTLTHGASLMLQVPVVLLPTPADRPASFDERSLREGVVPTPERWTVHVTPYLLPPTPAPPSSSPRAQAGSGESAGASGLASQTRTWL